MDPSPITIIGTPISHYVQTVILTCEEKRAPYILQVEGHDTHEALRSPTHLQWHPFGCIPAIEKGNVRLYETSAICRYIDRVYDGPSLVPDEPVDMARMEQWISAINCYYHKPCISHLVSQHVFPKGPGGQVDRQVIENAMPAINNAMQQLASTYEHSDYLAGERISLADLFIAPILMQMRQTPEGRECIGRFSFIEEKINQVFERPSFHKVLELHSAYLPSTFRPVSGSAC